MTINRISLSVIREVYGMPVHGGSVALSGGSWGVDLKNAPEQRLTHDFQPITCVSGIDGY